MKEKVIVTGAIGQDGSFLTKLLLEKGCVVVCLIRPSSNNSLKNHEILGIRKNRNLKYVYLDITDYYSVFNLIKKFNPDVIYNMAAKTFVKDSFDNPFSTFLTNSIATMYFLESIKIINPKCKFYQASSSEMFGKNKGKALNEKSSFNPVSPYAVSKTSSYYIVKYYRQAYSLFAVNGILFNHESFLRGSNFITKKVVRGLVLIKKGKKDILEIGNIFAERDWGHAKDYMEAVILMMNYKNPDDYVVATGKKFSVKFLIDYVATKLNINLSWKIDMKNKNYFAIDSNSKKIIIKSNQIHFREAEVDKLLGDISKIKKFLKWKPTFKFTDLIDEMIEFELKI